jgi:voltage-gated potassium channel Kch
LAERLRRDFSIDEVLSPPVLAAREFAAAALEPAPRRAAGSDVDPSRVGPHLPRRLSLHAAGGAGRPLAVVASRLLAAFLLFLFLTGVAVFQWQMGLSVVDAVYFTTTIMTTVGFGDFHLQREPPAVKLFGSLLMLSGITLIAVLASFLTNFLLSGSAAQRWAERTAQGYKNHVILCGLGSVGFEVAEDLIARRVRVVIVDETPGDVHWINLSSRVPLLVGDATRPDVLVRAGIDRARAVIAAASEDPINLEIGLVAQSVAEERRPTRPLRIVLRCFDPDLKRRVHAVSGVYTLLSSAEISAPIFVERALAER